VGVRYHFVFFHFGLVYIGWLGVGLLLLQALVEKKGKEGGYCLFFSLKNEVVLIPSCIAVTVF